MSRNVAIFGKFCAGKTTLALELEDEWGFSRVSMAGNMKNIIKDVYGTIDKSDTITVHDKDGHPSDISVREALQGFGENAKSHDLYFWLRWFLNDTQFMDGIPLVMDDARLRFEAQALREKGWLLVRMEAPEDVRRQRYFDLYRRYPTKRELTHKTETESDLIDVDLVLDGTLSPARLAEMVVDACGLSDVPEEV